MSEVFISYASEDKAVADQIAAAFAARGVSCWIAPESILPGQVYSEAIVAGLKSCSTLCVLVSPAANASKHVAREVGLADSEGKRIVPVRIAPVEPSDALSYFLSLPQWVEWHVAGPNALDPIVALLAGPPRPSPGPAPTPHGRPAPTPPAPIPPAPPVGLARLVIVRGGGGLAMLRQAAILIDGVKVGEVGAGKTFETTLPAGPHSVQARLDALTCSPFRFEARGGGDVRLRLSLPPAMSLDLTVMFDGDKMFKFTHDA